ncbi:MAG TPA: hypothetical protein VJN96_10000 [Vicinamibacterales bacterium]|nr:hypothetical protein [Vicinamibacterales bacterium]
MTAAEKQAWDAAIALGAATLLQLSRRDDAWLETEATFGSGQRVNNYFKWFHVFGHELNHRGQIRWLRSRIPRR